MVSHPAGFSPNAVRRYDLKTQVRTYVNKQQTDLKTHLQLQTTQMGVWQSGQRHYRVDQLASVYDNRPLLDPLVELGNLLNRRLEVVADPHLHFVDVYQPQYLYEQWVRGTDRQRFIQKHQHNPHLPQFLGAFEQQLQRGRLADQLRHKGFLGILFPGLMGHEGSFSTTKVVTDFVGPGLHLPLRLRVEQARQPDGSVVIEAEGVLNQVTFDQQTFRRLIRDMADAVHIKVDFSVAFRERYVVEGPGQQIVSGAQHLRAMVQGVYLSEVIHELTPLVG